MKAQQVIRALDDALAHTERLIEATHGDASRCTALEDRMGSPPLTDAQRRNVRLYVESWIAPPLRAALVLAREDDGPASVTVGEYVRFLNDRSDFGHELDEAAAGTPDEMDELLREAF